MNWGVIIIVTIELTSFTNLNRMGLHGVTTYGFSVSTKRMTAHCKGFNTFEELIEKARTPIRLLRFMKNELNWQMSEFVNIIEEEGHFQFCGELVTINMTVPSNNVSRSV